MIKLVARTMINQEFIKVIDPNIHTFWSFTFPEDENFECIIGQTGICHLYPGDGFSIVSGNMREWHMLMTYMLKQRDQEIREFATTFVFSFPDLFKEFPKATNSSGTILVRH